MTAYVQNGTVETTLNHLRKLMFWTTPVKKNHKKMDQQCIININVRNYEKQS